MCTNMECIYFLLSSARPTESPTVLLFPAPCTEFRGSKCFVFCNEATLLLVLKKKKRKSFLFQVYRSAGSKISLKPLFRIPLSLPQTFGKTYMNYRPGNDLFMYLILFLKENIYLRLWLPCSSQGT